MGGLAHDRGTGRPTITSGVSARIGGSRTQGTGWWAPVLAAIALVALVLAVVDDGPPLSAPAAAVPAPAEFECPLPFPGVVSRGPAGARAIALTFDDGPSDQTAHVLRALRRHDARATFFPLGREIPGREHLLRRAVREGHEIGNHSTTHAELPTAPEIGRASCRERVL